MATSLGKVGIVNKGNYSSKEIYNSGDFVFYEGSTWLALKDNLLGVEPGEGENWKYLARGVPENIQDEIDSIKNNKLDKTEFDNLTIGGRNLARETSIEYVKSMNHSGGTNVVARLGRVYTSGLKFGDTLTVRLLYKYSDIVIETEQTGTVGLQGSGDVTGWGNGSFCSKYFQFAESNGEYEFLYSFKINENHLKNEYWNITLRHDNIASGTSTWKMFKVERGTKPTDWTPAPEDFQDQINSIQNPTFDDSGTTEGINSFTDFMEKVKSKMNIFQFYRDFKAGMKYVLHTGRLANNVTTTQEGFALDARMGKTLQDQITDVNNNINGREIMKHLPFNGTDLNTINIDDASGNFVAGFTNDVTEGTFPNKSWQNIVQFDTYHFRSQFSVTSDGRGGHPKPAIRSWWGSVWSDWYSLVTNNDLQPQKIEATTYNLEYIKPEHAFFFAYKASNLVCYTMDTEILKDIPDSTILFTIPESIRPKDRILIPILNGVNQGCVAINTDGTVRAWGSISYSASWYNGNTFGFLA